MKSSFEWFSPIGAFFIRILLRASLNLSKWLDTASEPIGDPGSPKSPISLFNSCVFIGLSGFNVSVRDIGESVAFAY
jgi:hypothetical protein